ncbi:F-ATPase gamma subunit [Sedimentisphaera cyanobacteriorum]|uniref:ATP synthase gamma chain n=1 Tax=Sedimentisphaera cyanobacteriorum TaxID=1940790 RepID=A0A1Q2HP13_9BACT|nr:ATP synthase F1 subunit gamma [Sedimentisphaera cyanobacteriorum]AQQ09090.1 F-ATPase gamma subunit [Sedimentisphaera cyanobacteriorum]
MASIRQILQRKRAVANIRKVTKTMEMISTSRYRQYFDMWQSGQKFYNYLAELAYLMLTSDKKIEHPLMQENESGNIAILVIGANRGLCGGFNSALNHMIEVHIKRAKRLRKKLIVYVSGKKAAAYLRHKGVKVKKEFSDFEEMPTAKQSDDMADDFMNLYINGEVDYFGIVHTRFFSVASQKPQTLTILPVSELIDDLTTRSTVIWPWSCEAGEFELEPDLNEMFEGMVRMMLRTAVSGCFVNSVLSEYLARVVAMKSATDNAEDMIKALNSQYNSARQNKITTELTDIVSGVEALG